MGSEDITHHQCWRPMLGRLSHRHHSHSLSGEEYGLAPDCERCGTPIDAKHKETGPVSWFAPVRPRRMTEMENLREEWTTMFEMLEAAYRAGIYDEKVAAKVGEFIAKERDSAVRSNMVTAPATDAA